MTENHIQKKVLLPGVNQLKVFGPHDSNLRIIQESFHVKISARGQNLLIEGAQASVADAERALEELVSLASRQGGVSGSEFETILSGVSYNSETKAVPNENPDNIILYKKEGFVKPKTAGQQNFFNAAFQNDIVFSIGPAGTGKTFLAVAFAVAHLRDKLVDRIVLTRPAVEAGERLGYLPGDFREKIDPYLRPLYDALHDMIPDDKLKRYLDSAIIEIVPLAYMRGRTLNNAFVILDEAQNSTFNQMKMFLTRLGINSRAIITGDVSQIDLNDEKSSGLVQVQHFLNKIDGIKFTYMSDADVVRHKLVRDIIKAYDGYKAVQSDGL